MRAISETLSTLIIASTVIVVSLLIFYMSITLINDQMATSEYGYIKSMFVEIANNYHLILQGNNYVSAKPHRHVGVGYKLYTGRWYIIKYNTTIPEYIDHIVVKISLEDPTGTAYSGPNYYVVNIYLYLVNREILNVHWKLIDNLGLTEPAATIIDYIYFRNGSSIQIFDVSSGDATPLVTLPYQVTLYPGDQIHVLMNDNYNDNNYGDGAFPIEFTSQGFRSYSSCYEGGGFFHNTSVIITNLNNSASGGFSHYKPANTGVYYTIDYVNLLFYSGISYSITDDTGTETGRINNIHTDLYHIVIVDRKPASIDATVYKPLVTHSRVVYGNRTIAGECSFIVKDIRLIPCIHEYYLNGATHLEFDNRRFYVTIYKLGSGSQINYVVRIVYIKINPILIGTGGATFKVIPYRTIIYRKVKSINYLELIEYDSNTNSIINSKILVSEPSIPTSLVYVIRQVNVVIG